MGFFKKKRGGGKIGSYAKGGGIKGKQNSLGGYSLYSHEKKDGGSSTPVTKRTGKTL